jgi:hypothetical protein
LALKNYSTDEIWLLGGHPDYNSYKADIRIYPHTNDIEIAIFYLNNTGNYDNVSSVSGHDGYSYETHVRDFEPLSIKIKYGLSSQRLLHKEFELYQLE